MLERILRTLLLFTLTLVTLVNGYFVTPTSAQDQSEYKVDFSGVRSDPCQYPYRTIYFCRNHRQAFS